MLRAFLLDLLVAAPAVAAEERHPAWSAKWIADAEAPPQEAGLFHFRRSFTLSAVPAHFIVNVSADNRYRLFVNGKSVATGPARGDLMHWHYETVDLAPWLKPGRNLIAAEVWNWGDLRPLFQISHRTAFLLHGKGPTEAAIDTGAGWKVFWDKAYSFGRLTGIDTGGFYAASPQETVNARLYPWGWEKPDFDDRRWLPAQPLSEALPRGASPFGLSADWQLVPRTIPQPEESPIRFAALRRTEGIKADARFLKGEGDLIIPAHSRVALLLDQGYLTMGYPVIETRGGMGATIALTYAESLFDAQGNKGNRDEIAGKTIRGLHDHLILDGGARRFQPLWLRTWRYLQLDVRTGAAPLSLHDVHGIYTAYPFQQHAVFASDQKWIDGIWDIDWRVFRMSAFESFWDTPYYEQLQYVGDARIEALLSLYQTGDDRLMRNAIEQFDQSRTPEGLTAMAYPSRSPGYIPPFSLWWVAMLHDYWMLRDDPAFVRNFLPGMRGVIAWYEQQVDGTDMLGPMPWWNFLDWNKSFDRGTAPGSENGHSTALTLQFSCVLRQAAEIEQALGEPALAARDRALSERLNVAVRAQAWDAAKGLFADTPGGSAFSQHTNTLAILAGAVPDTDQAALMRRVLSDPSLLQASYYFRFYVDEAMEQAGLADLYLDRLDPWREMVRNGLTTTPENPEPTRSDSHAWSAHPNYHLLTTVLGIRPGSPGFRTVRIVPALGALRQASGHIPHLAGTIDVKLARTEANGISGTVILPAGLSGTFVWKGQEHALSPGINQILY
jgi:hypothetical protein